MPRKKKRAFSDATLREVKREMAKPRIVQSVRRAASFDPGPAEARSAPRSVLTRFSAIAEAKVMFSDQPRSLTRLKSPSGHNH